MCPGREKENILNAIADEKQYLNARHRLQIKETAGITHRTHRNTLPSQRKNVWDGVTTEEPSCKTPFWNPILQ